MIVKVLASGSKGNVTIVKTKHHNILIDAGLPLSSIIKRVDSFPDIDTMIITHTHTDHIKGIKSYINRYSPKVFTKTRELEKLFPKLEINYENYEDEDIILNLFDLSHDTPCCGIYLEEKVTQKELVYITDTGYINKKILEKIDNKDIYIMESNHDVERLMHSKYPFYLQQRILSDKGHLSNATSSSYLRRISGSKTKYVILAHLSEENNTPELAKEEAIKALKNKNINLMIAKQDEALDKVEV